MSVFVIADTHLSLSVEKPMDVFGCRWENYQNKIKENWQSTVRANDTVVIPGDISWGMNLEQARDDLLFLENLPGKKILLKGNHDFWWETAAKLNRFTEENSIRTLSFLQNNAFRAENYIICGSRGWYTDDKKVNAQNAPDAQKIIQRECIRLRMSLEAGKKLQQQTEQQEGFRPQMLAFLHFPPYFKGYICDELILELYRYEINRCFYGHIHASYDIPMTAEYMDIRFSLISADYLNFIPYRIESIDEN